MCKCCQSCLETIWWHLIEKRFCYDENIALYDVEKIHEEKNNNIFENMAFFDSVSVIAGRSVVTIDSPKKFQIPVIQQPRLSIISNSSQTNQNRISLEKTLSKSTPDILKTHKADPNELDASSDTEEALQKALL
ncbi:hypothetical protein HHI36_003272 [Cryptolaemus montrouzieri]|uniref:Uncharacterized protein n=1 Tax=Cryptolaemus montrouzieri TaxID=559131 RepID=A0ABD2PD54_9CUCU